MTTIQHDENGRLNAVWHHPYEDGTAVRELGLYVFDANDEPANSIRLTEGGRATLAAFLGKWPAVEA